MARNYKGIQAYQLSYEFVLNVYKITSSFPESEERNITSQIRRASVSIPLNIAEGSTKASRKEFLHYLNTAYGSAKEVEVILQLCFDLGYLNDNNYDLLSSSLDELNAKLFLFMRNIESRIENRRHHFFKKFEDRNPNEIN